MGIMDCGKGRKAIGSGDEGSYGDSYTYGDIGANYTLKNVEE